MNNKLAKTKMDERTGKYNVTISLDEQRTGKISLGVGVDSTSGFFGSVGFSENNFRGLWQKLSINFMAGTGILMNDSSIINRPNLQAELGFIEPHFKSENQSLGFRAFVRNFGSYQVPLSIEKRSSEIWQLLGVFKQEFGKFVDLLAKTQKKLAEASNTIESATKKSRTIERKLKNVTGIEEESDILLESGEDEINDDGE